MIIPVHTPQRPVGRAVASAVAGGLPVSERGGVRVTVVCHNIGPELIRDRLAARHRPLVDLLEYFDDTGNPAGARNLALERSTARYVAFLDSDDSLAPGALAAWTAVAEQHASDAVLPRMVTDTGRTVRTPVPRPLHRGALDPVRDRLAYRTSCFGLLRRDALARRGARFDGRYATGEDQELAARTWFGGGRIDRAPRTAVYVVHDGATDRISGTARPVRQELAAFTGLLGGTWYAGLPAGQRTALAVKVLRVQLFGAVRARTGAGSWTEGDARACRELLELVRGLAPDAPGVLSRADRDVLDLLGRPGISAGALAAASDARRRFGRPATLLTRDPRTILHRDAPLRFMAASLLV